MDDESERVKQRMANCSPSVAVCVVLKSQRVFHKLGLMKVLSLLLLAPLLWSATPTRADDKSDESALTPEQSRMLTRVFGGDQVPYGNGLDDLISATDANDLESVSAARLFGGAATEKQRLRGVALERNARALELARQGLARGVARRVSLSQELSNDIYLNARLRTLTRLFDMEGEFYAAQGQPARALDAYLDAMELSVVTPSGGSWQSFLGAGNQGVERAAIAELVPQLNAGTLRHVALRLRQIERRRPPVIELWRAEKLSALAEIRDYWPELTEKVLRENFGLSSKEAREVKRLTREQLLFQTSERYDEILRRTQWTFARRAREPLPPSNALLEKRYPYKSLEIEQLYRTFRARNLLLADALELRVIRLETQFYPATFQTAPDPFGDNSSLLYRRTGESYALYSVGPNGIDDGARPVDKKQGAQLLATGDIVAPIF